MKQVARVLLFAGLFAIAMGFLESAVVVYLRAIYYPGGFCFPLKLISGTIAVTEVFREAATMVMLLAVAWISIRGALERFAIFIYAFAVWDIFYYVFLYVLLGWPPSLFTWDILFLIPVTWVGPVLAPVINSLTMILLAVLIIRFRSFKDIFRLTSTEWLLLAIGTLVNFWSYTESYLRYMLSRFSFSEVFRVNSSREVIEYSSSFIPVHFSWTLFITAEILFVLAILSMIRRMRNR
jgi:hypothetical protein